jgi:hypothetical protein
MSNDSPPPLESAPLLDIPSLASRKRKREMDSEDELDLESQRIQLTSSVQQTAEIDKRERHNTKELLRILQQTQKRVTTLEKKLATQTSFFLTYLAEMQVANEGSKKVKKTKKKEVKIKKERVVRKKS